MPRAADSWPSDVVWGVIGGRAPLTASELADWEALWALEHEEREQAQRKAKAGG